MAITLTQQTEFLVAVRAGVPMMGKNGRIIAITYAPGGQTGSWQPWVAMGSAKAAKEALARYFAVALAQKGITVNIISPGACDDSVLSGLPPQVFQMIKDWHESGWTPMRRLGLPADVCFARTATLGSDAYQLSPEQKKRIGHSVCERRNLFAKEFASSALTLRFADLEVFALPTFSPAIVAR